MSDRIDDLADADGGQSDVLDKADEFLKRRRAQLGGSIADGALRDEAQDDIPILTEVVGAETVVVAQTAAQKKFDAEVAHELEAWLDENLPQVVVHAMDGITDKLIQQIHASARADLLPRLHQVLRGDNAAGEDQTD